MPNPKNEEAPKLLKPGESKDKYKLFQKIGLINKPKGSVTQGLASEAADASADIKLSKGPDFKQGSLTAMGEEMKTGTSFKGLDGESYSDKEQYLSANKSLLNKQEAQGIKELKQSFSNQKGSSGKVIGMAFTDTEEDSKGVERFIQQDRNFSGGKTGIVASGIPNADVEIGSISRNTLNNSVGGIGNRIKSAIRVTKGAGSNSNTAFQEKGIDQVDFNKQEKYSPLGVSRFNVAGFKSDKSSNIKSFDGKVFDASKSTVDKITVAQPVLSIKDKVQGNDRFQDLAIKEKLSPAIYNRELQARKGGKIKKGNVLAGKPGKNKVVKLKGMVDLDMSGKVDSNFEKAAKTFAGGGKGTKSNIYSNRKDARKSLKGKDTKTTPIQGRSIEYSANGNTKSEAQFKRLMTRQHIQINNNRASYNTQHMNSGQPLSSLKGNNSYASNFNVNASKATGQEARAKLSKLQEKSNLSKFSKRATRKMNKS